MESDVRIVFFDGECPFCIGWVKFLLDRDAGDRLRFASLQSKWSHNFFEEKGLPLPKMDSVLVWDGAILYSESKAIIALAEVLPGIWHFGRHIDVFSEKVRNGAYRFIASRRYNLFGRKKSCWLPGEEYKRKFLDLSDPVYETS